MEECAEVIQAVTKGNRFGYDFIKPGTTKTNREHLEEEIGDVLAMIDILLERGFINEEALEKATLAKIEKLKKWSTIYGEVKSQ